MKINTILIEKLKATAFDKCDLNYCLAACLLNSNKMISNIYCNSFPKNPIVFYECHAESKTLSKYYCNKNKYKKLNLLVIRINKDYKLCNARPCYHCLQMMIKYNIDKVFYSIDEYNIVSEKVNDMISIHLSKYYNFVTLTNKYDKILYLFKYYFTDSKINLKMYNITMFIEHSFKLLFPQYVIKYSKNKTIVSDINNNIVYIIIGII